MNKKIFIIIFTIIISIVLVGCSSSKTKDTDDGSITLKIWAPQEEQEILVDMTNAFLLENPDYNIKFEFGIMGVEASISAMKKDSEVAADVFMYPSGGIAELTAAGLILPITLNVEHLKEIHSENSIAATTLNGKMYGVPVTPNSWFMYYNKALYTEEEVKSLETMMNKDLGEGVFNFSSKLSDSWYLSAFFFSVGGELFGPDGTDPTSVNFNDENGFEVGKYLIDLAKNPKYVEDESGLAGKLIAENKLGAFTSGIWSAAQIKKDLGENYGAVKLPVITVNGTEHQLTNFVDYKVYGVNSATKHPKEAIELAIWLGNEESQMIRFEENNEAPTIKTLLNHPQVIANLEVTALLDQEKHSIPQPVNPKLSDFWTPVSAFGFELVNGKITESNLQKKLDEMVNGIIAE